MTQLARSELVLADTSAWICFFARHGYPDIKTRLISLLDRDLVATAGPIALELIQGCRSSNERRDLEERLRALHWLPTEDRHWITAGNTAFTLRRVGITVAAIDALIATLAATYGCTLLHRDRDFDLIARHSNLRVFAP